MTAMLAEPRLALGGAPFLDDDFGAGRLLAAVCAMRHSRGMTAGRAARITEANITTWLTPARAAVLNTGAPRLPAAPLRPSRLAAIEQATAALGTAVPAWAPLLGLPVRFAALHPPTGAISASIRSWPQHVLLAAEAFATESELAEQVLHEIAHQWMYLVMEVWPMTGEIQRLFTLPSGTGGKQAWEVLGAAHVAAVLRRWYRCGPASSPVRAKELREYAEGCLALLPAAELAPAGELFVERIKEAL